MVLSAWVLEDDRKRTGRDEKTAQGGQEVCWLAEENCSTAGLYFLSSGPMPPQDSTVGPRLTDDHYVQHQPARQPL